jgi:hypothetical protein
MKQFVVAAAGAWLSAAAMAWMVPQGPQGAVPPGGTFDVPPWPGADGAPQIYEHSQSAGPDETLFLVGTNLTRDVAVWGHDPESPGGRAVPVKVQLATSGYLAFTVPDSAYDGPMVVTVKNAAGYAAPVVINAPQPWWCAPSAVEAGATHLSVFGRDLGCRPDRQRACAWLSVPGRKGEWLDVEPPRRADRGSYELRVRLPSGLRPVACELWLHGGRGGAWGWGGPLRVEVLPKRKLPGAEVKVGPGEDVQAALDKVAARGGGAVLLSGGRYPFTGTLRVPANVALRGLSGGRGGEAPTLELQPSSPETFARPEAAGWNLAPGGIHTRGDAMDYTLDLPRDGRWAVWLRYATDMSPWKQVGVSGNSAIRLDDGPWLALEDLPNTGGFGAYRWSRSAVLDAKAGRHALTWQNVKGGGLSLDAFVLLSDTNAVPSDQPWPANSATSVVVHGEACVRFACKEGSLPKASQAAIWLSGDYASLEGVTVLGNAQVNQGVAIRASEPGRWLTGCRVSAVKLADCEGKQAENCGVYVRNLRGGEVTGCELWGRTPLFLSGARESLFADNRLVSVTRFGGNAEAAILGRCEPLERCRIMRNTVVSPPGAGAGGPTARRLIWLSTGHGSIAENWIADNGVEFSGAAGQARFGGVAGTDQNVGEMILFEGNHRTMYFGPLAGADAQGVTLPATLPHTPDARLGSVKREQLAHDVDGRETPFWPPDVDDGTAEPPISEYYVTVFAGPGQGQTRRVASRAGERLLVDRPWRVAPEAGSVVAVGTMFHRNVIVGNRVPDGMTGVQLWISCVENVVAGNTVERQRKPGLFFYANGSTLASSMPRTWNRGVSPLFWNVAEGNRTDTCSDGALVTSGDAADLPVEFPRALGNVLRHNSFAQSRQSGVIVTSRKAAAGVADRSASVVGTVVEFNVVRDAPVAFHVAQGADGAVVRRNHAYAWQPQQGQAVGFLLADPSARVALEANTVEGRSGVKDGAVIEVKKSWEK